MARIRLIHWKPEDGDDRAAPLRASGHEVAIGVPQPALIRAMRNDPPDAVVIDLDRVPSQGRDFAFLLRSYKATRDVPLVFAGGKPDKVAPIRKRLPHAAYTPWSRIRSTVKRALANPPAPGSSSSALGGYSGTPLSKKLGIREGSVVVLVGAPRGFEATMAPLPRDVVVTRRPRRTRNLTLWFVRSSSELACIGRLTPFAGRGGLWIAWQKKSSGFATDVTERAVRQTALDAGIVDFKICSIDATWSGLRFSHRQRRS